MSPLPRNALVAAAVVLLHAAALWALQSGLLRRTVETVVPVEILASIVTPPSVIPPSVPPPAAAPSPAPRRLPELAAPPVTRKPAAPPPAARPLARPDAAPSAAAPTATSEPQPTPPPANAPAATAAVPAPAAPAPAAPATAAPAPKVELPTSSADYLNNPPPEYPRLSFKLGEQGTTIVRVLIGPDGRAQDAQVARSSGFVRLDQAAERTARSWRYVPGKRGGVAEAMWVNVPIIWEIKGANAR